MNNYTKTLTIFLFISFAFAQTQLGSDIDGEAAGDQSGESVSMNSAGDRVAIGAYYNDGTGHKAGHVRVYEYSNSIWTQVGSDIDGEAASDNSGVSVSMNSAGDRVAIGAYGNDGTGNAAGHVRVYEDSSGSWTQVGSDIDGEAFNDTYGYSVSMDSAGDGQLLAHLLMMAQPTMRVMYGFTSTATAAGPSWVVILMVKLRVTGQVTQSP